jgi:hypothetical protein
MRKQTRLFIAISELTGGLILMIGPALAGLMRVHLPLWYLVLCESLAGIAVIAAYRLLQDRWEGYALSLFLQGAQLVQFLLPHFLYSVTLGSYLVVILSAEKTLISPGIKGQLTIGWMGPASPAVGVNVVAATFFCLLARAILQQRRRLRILLKSAEPTL